MDFHYFSLILIDFGAGSGPSVPRLLSNHPDIIYFTFKNDLGPIAREKQAI